MYKNFTDAEKKKFFNTFIDSVEIFPEEQPDGRVLKSISFKFPVFYDGEDNITKICWDGETTVETVALLSRQKVDEHIYLDVNVSTCSKPSEPMLPIHR